MSFEKKLMIWEGYLIQDNIKLINQKVVQNKNKFFLKINLVNLKIYKMLREGMLKKLK